VSMDEAVNFLDEVGGGNERAAADGALGDESEEAFNLVEPGGIEGLYDEIRTGRPRTVADEAVAELITKTSLASPRPPPIGACAIGDEAIAPFADRMRADAKPRRHGGVAGLAFAGQDDLRPQRQCCGQERDRVMASSCLRSSLDIVSIAFGRPDRIGYLLQSGYPNPMQ
jgi:hypothetical protein